MDESLYIGDLTASLKPRAAEYPWMPQRYQERNVIIKEHRYQAMNGPYIRPDLTEGIFYPGVFTAKNIWGRTLAQQELDWLTTQRFWLFLRTINTTTASVTRTTRLRELRLDASLNLFFDEVSTDFFCDTLARFKELAFLENNYLSVSLDTLFSILPSLRHFRGIHLGTDDGILKQPYPHLNILELGTQLAAKAFYVLLRCLPNLDQLRFREFRDIRNITADEMAEWIGGKPSCLTHLCIDVIRSTECTAVLNALCWLPNLTHITFGKIYPSIASTIGQHCKKVQHIRESVVPSNYPSNYQNLDILSLKILFRECRNLHSFDGMFQMVSLNSLVASDTAYNTVDNDTIVDYDDDEAWLPWVCDQMTQLCCQFGKLERLTGPEQELYDKISAPRYTARVPKGRHLAVTLKHELSMAQHDRMYKYLARLSCLTVLNVGYEVKAWQRAAREAETVYRNINGIRDEDYLALFGPVSGTLELTLESGLGRLAALENLEVFGFEGVDHRMGQAEIEWMAVSWPRLKALRGLRQDYPPRIDYERRKVELRKLMEELRPDVKHEVVQRGTRVGSW
ncbi:hypothetical protein EC991_006330 [Linnemannia zychae]|nr:hypothetical protein EC991_006330 [Linnemannia zychae]